MIDGQFAVAFAAGLVAVANPCGFAMLPAYLSFFLGVEGKGGDDARAGLSRALAVGLAVSAGFVATFAVITAVIRNITGDVLDWSPWISVAIGIAVAGFGVALLSGKELKINLPRLDRGGQSGSLGQMALYGVSYAVVSLGCTLPTFSAYITATINTESWISGVAIFLAYAGGFTLLLTSLTVGIALARQGLVRTVRRALPYVQRISGGLLVVAGLYVAYYGWYELRRLGDEDVAVDRVTGWSNDVAAWVTDVGPVRLGFFLALIVAAAAIAVASRRRTAA
jgi:cytochrome c-type biogenesis protein